MKTLGGGDGEQQDGLDGGGVGHDSRHGIRHGVGPAEAASTAPLGTLLREDFRTHSSSLVHPGLHALVVHRIGFWGLSQPDPVRRAVKVAHRLVNRLVIQNLYGTEIADEAIIGRRVSIGHHQAVQIPAFAVIGDDSVLRSGITIGFTDGAETRREAVPHIGRDVSIGPGAVLVGAITIGDGARIGPNANVSTDVPAGATAFAPPARVLRPQARAEGAQRAAGDHTHTA